MPLGARRIWLMRRVVMDLKLPMMTLNDPGVGRRGEVFARESQSSRISATAGVPIDIDSVAYEYLAPAFADDPQHAMQVIGHQHVSVQLDRGEMLGNGLP